MVERGGIPIDQSSLKEIEKTEQDQEQLILTAFATEQIYNLRNFFTKKFFSREVSRKHQDDLQKEKKKWTEEKKIGNLLEYEIITLAEIFDWFSENYLVIPTTEYDDCFYQTDALITHHPEKKKSTSTNQDFNLGLSIDFTLGRGVEHDTGGVINKLVKIVYGDDTYTNGLINGIGTSLEYSPHDHLADIPRLVCGHSLNMAHDLIKIIKNKSLKDRSLLAANEKRQDEQKKFSQEEKNQIKIAETIFFDQIYFGLQAYEKFITTLIDDRTQIFREWNQLPSTSINRVKIDRLKEVIQALNIFKTKLIAHRSTIEGIIKHKIKMIEQDERSEIDGKSKAEILDKEKNKYFLPQQKDESENKFMTIDDIFEKSSWRTLTQTTRGILSSSDKIRPEYNIKTRFYIPSKIFMLSNERKAVLPKDDGKENVDHVDHIYYAILIKLHQISRLKAPKYEHRNTSN